MPAPSQAITLQHADATDPNLAGVFERWLYGADHLYDGAPVSGPEGVFIVDTGGSHGPTGETYAVLAGAYADDTAPSGPWRMAALVLFDRDGRDDGMLRIGQIGIEGLDTDQFDALMQAYDGYDTFSFENLFVGFAINVTVAEDYATALDYEFLTAQVDYTGGAAGDRFVSGDMDDAVAGRGGDDVIRSGGGADRIDGGAGDDDINPGAGADVIIGGEGADDVSVDPLEMDGDLWTDFAAQDELILRGARLSQVAAVAIAGGVALSWTPEGAAAPAATMTLLSETSPVAHALVQVGDDVMFTAANQPPVPQDDAVQVTRTGVRFANLLDDNGAGDDLDPEGRGLTVTAVSFGAVGAGVDLDDGGRIRVNANGDVWFDPDGDFDDLTGLDTREVTITYTVTDDRGASATAEAVFTIGAPNHAPEARIHQVFNFGAQVTTGNVFDSRGFGADDDRDGDPIEVVQVGWITTAFNASTHGFVDTTHWVDVHGATTVSTLGRSFTVSADGDFSYDAGAGGQGEARFLYRISDGRGGEDEGRVDFISSASTPGRTDPLIPLDAVDDVIATNQVALVSGSLLADNGAGEDGYPRFDLGSSDIAYSTPSSASEPFHAIPFGAVLSVDGDLAIVGTSFDLADGGRVRVEQDGSFIFNPDGDFDDLAPGESRTASFRYELTDSFATDEALVTFEVVAPAGLEARDDAFDMRAGGLLNGGLLNDNGSGADVGADRVTRAAGRPIGEAVALEDGGTLRVRKDGRFWFDAGDDFDDLASGETATVSFSYVVAGDGAKAPGQVSIVVHGNEAPVAADDAVSSGPGRLTAANLFEDNGAGADFDPDGDGLRVVFIDGDAAAVGARQALAEGGAWRLYEDGRFWVNARDGFEHVGAGDMESFAFNYTVRDAVGHLSTAHAVIEIHGDLMV